MPVLLALLFFLFKLSALWVCAKKCVGSSRARITGAYELPYYVLRIKLRSHFFSPFMFVLIQSYVPHTVLELVIYPLFYKCMPPYQVYEVLKSVTC